MATLDLSQFKTVWTESFDGTSPADVLGMFSRSWGPGVDTSVSGQLTLHSTADNQDSGAMVPPTGAGAGYGYGLYSMTLLTQGTVGIYADTWPASDVWPGPELDIMEIDGNGKPYSTIHWKGADGSNQFTAYALNIDPKQVHTFQMWWDEVAGTPTIKMYVDGVEQWETTANVPKDFAHGGENTAPGIGVQTWWNGGALGGNNWITIYDASYAQAVPPPSGHTVGAPVQLTAGTGPDTLVLKISEYAFKGDAQYTVTVDGKQVGATFTASADHDSGQSDMLTLRGDWAAGAHVVAVNFLNDYYEGSWATDRNLYLDSATYNGVAVSGATLGIWNATAANSFTFTDVAVVGTLPTASVGSATKSVMDFGGTSYATYASTVAWGSGPIATLAPTAWNSAYATHMAFDNFVQTDVNLTKAGSVGIDLMLVDAKRGTIALGDGADHVTWVAESNSAGASLNTMTMSTGGGDDVVTITTAGLSSFDDKHATGNGTLYNATYDGRYSIADVTFGSGHDTVTVSGRVALTLHGGSGLATVQGGDGADRIIVGSGGATISGGAGNDTIVLAPGAGHAVMTDFVARADKLQFGGGITAAGVHVAIGSENGVSGLEVVYDAAGDSIFLAGATRIALTDMLFV